MAAIYIGGKLAGTPEQFNQMVAEVLEKRPTRVIRTLNLDEVISSLETLRKDVETEVNKPIDCTRISAGMFLFDICEVLGLTEAESQRVIGEDVYERVLNAVLKGQQEVSA